MLSTLVQTLSEANPSNKWHKILELNLATPPLRFLLYGTVAVVEAVEFKIWPIRPAYVGFVISFLFLSEPQLLQML